MKFSPSEHPHKRFNPLLQEWLLVSPLLRSHAIKKFMFGYEMMAEPQRDITPEQAANIIRSQSNIHYKEAVN